MEAVALGPRAMEQPRVLLRVAGLGDIPKRRYPQHLSRPARRSPWAAVGTELREALGITDPLRPLGHSVAPRAAAAVSIQLRLLQCLEQHLEMVAEGISIPGGAGRAVPLQTPLAAWQRPAVHRSWVVEDREIAILDPRPEGMAELERGGERLQELTPGALPELVAMASSSFGSMRDGY